MLDEATKRAAREHLMHGHADRTVKVKDATVEIRGVAYEALFYDDPGDPFYPNEGFLVFGEIPEADRVTVYKVRGSEYDWELMAWATQEKIAELGADAQHCYPFGTAFWLLPMRRWKNRPEREDSVRISIHEL